MDTVFWPENLGARGLTIICNLTCQVMSCQVSSVTHIVCVESGLVCAESRSWTHGHSVGCLMMAETDDRKDKRVLRCCCIALAEAGVHKRVDVCSRAKRCAHRELMEARERSSDAARRG